MALPPEVFCDTSFFYACFDPKDVNHFSAQRVVAEAASCGTRFHSTWDNRKRNGDAASYRRHFHAALAFLTDVKPALRIVAYGDRVRDEAEQVFRHYGQDHRLSFCDAISFVVVTTLLGHMPCLTFDEDFRHLGLTVLT